MFSEMTSLLAIKVSAAKCPDCMWPPASFQPSKTFAFAESMALLVLLVLGIAGLSLRLRRTRDAELPLGSPNGSLTF